MCMYACNIIYILLYVVAEHIPHLEKVTKDNANGEEQCQQPSPFSVDWILEQF